MIDENQAQQAVRSLLLAIGEDPGRYGLRATPERVTRMFAELFSGVGIDPASAIDTLFDSPDQELELESQGDAVVLRDVPFFSVCEHHLLPFFGKAHMGYLPDGKIAGASKLVRALEVAARRPQVQERMTSQVADAICQVLKPHGVVVVLEAEHLCMAMRGVKKQGSLVITSATRGPFAKGGTSPGDLLALIKRS